MGEKRGNSDVYARQFAAVKASLPGHDLPWLAALRASALERFTALGFPTRKVEEWKFTDLRPLTRTTFSVAPQRANGVGSDVVARFALKEIDCHLLVFVDGHYHAELSHIGPLPAGARLSSLAEALRDHPELIEAHLGNDGAIDGHATAALNTALMTDGGVLELARGVALERPVHLLFLGTGGETAAHVRNLIVAGAASSATVIETYAALDDGATYWTNAVSNVVAEADAALRHVKVQAESVAAFHLAAARVRLARGSVYHAFAASVGARLSRNEIAAVLDGSGIDCRLNGIYLARGRQHVDTTTVIDHAMPASFSSEHYMGVLDDAAHGVFQGKIVVRPDAQKTDAHQLNKNLLLSERAQADTKPELEIHADDVKCSHGAATGALDTEAMFYLRSRGLDGEAATSLLIEAFVGEVVELEESPAVRAHLWRFASAWLGGRKG